MTIKKITSESSLLVNRLTAWGLSAVESEVYVYLLQKTTEMGASKIALGTGLHRQYVYSALEGLLEKALVEGVTMGKYKKYKALSPYEIEKITRKKSTEAGDLVTDLNKISAIHNNQDFEVLQGAKQIQRFEMDYVRESDGNDEEYIIGGHSAGFMDVMGDYLNEYLEEKSKKQVKVLYIGSAKEEEFYKEYTNNFPNQEYRFMKDLPSGVSHMVVRKNMVLFYSFLTPPLLYVIKSDVVAANYKHFFMMLWNIAGNKA